LQASEQDLKYASTTLQADLDRFQRQKVADLRHMTIQLAQIHREWCKQVSHLVDSSLDDAKLMSRTLKLGKLLKPLSAISNLTPINLLRQRLTLSLPSSLTNLDDFLHLPARRHLAAHQLFVPAVQIRCSWAG
jgi:hypothetical protein